MKNNLKKKAITFIGMPSSGKSTVGRILAKKINWNYVDLDILIREKEGRGHDKILKERGEEKFKKLEESYALELTFDNLVFAPGGSMIFSELAMKKIKENSIVIHLGVSKEQIEKRLGKNLHKDGIVGLETKGLAGVMEERAPLYKKYADYFVDTSELGPEKVLREILEKFF